MRTKLQTFKICYDPTSPRTSAGKELACIRLQIALADGTAVWTDPLTGSELTKILGAEYVRADEARTDEGLSIVTALQTSAAFNAISTRAKDVKKLGEAIVPKKPSEAAMEQATVKWLGDVRVRRIPAGMTAKKYLAEQTKAAKEPSAAQKMNERLTHKLAIQEAVADLRGKIHVNLDDL